MVELVRNVCCHTEFMYLIFLCDAIASLLPLPAPHPATSISMGVNEYKFLNIQVQVRLKKI